MDLRLAIICLQVVRLEATTGITALHQAPHRLVTMVLLAVHTPETTARLPGHRLTSTTAHHLVLHSMFWAMCHLYLSSCATRQSSYGGYGGGYGGNDYAPPREYRHFSLHTYHLAHRYHQLVLLSDPLLVSSITARTSKTMVGTRNRTSCTPSVPASARPSVFVALHTWSMDCTHGLSQIGINYFGQNAELKGCINDARNIQRFLMGRFHAYFFLAVRS